MILKTELCSEENVLASYYPFLVVLSLFNDGILYNIVMQIGRAHV